ncbi:unnamed protein product [Zymoseptoria tritici ST99CH_3D7]|uniref:trimethyllysine dioxygenase n=1 Tax=Zymoseptoria tritici (strain ST99CH_3D7) TaxID=1276538 RepID=A0A1X7RIJ0_ZYMT9|nr:unnamed protein product [Zymoseptoria tritici ST99CH_3D7]
MFRKQLVQAVLKSTRLPANKGSGTRHISSSYVRFNATPIPISSQVDRVARDEPFDRTGTSSKGYQASSKLDRQSGFEPSAVSSQQSSVRCLSKHPLPRLEAGGVDHLSLRFEDGSLKIVDEREGRSTTISGRWLRDNCACSQCRNGDTAQRQINVFKGTLDCTVRNCEIGNGQDGSVTVTFGDGHQSEFPTQSLLRRRSDGVTKGRYGRTTIKPWTADIASSRPSVPYTDMSTDAGMGTLLHRIRTYGFCIIENLPATPEATESLLECIGPIRNTHYGGFYDFTSDLSSKDTAYTSESLEPHTDNTYFTEPAGLQALHMLSHTDGSGGESSLVDGFNAALQLYNQDPEAYLTLSNTGVYAHASGNEGISIQPAQAFPTLSHDPEQGYLTQVRWNNADRAGIAADFANVDRWYDAAAKFDALLNDPKNVYWFQLKPGQLLLFDNWRVLHGRAAFTGKRRMCGGYINRDDFISRYRATNLSEGEVRLATVTG